MSNPNTEVRMMQDPMDIDRKRIVRHYAGQNNPEVFHERQRYAKVAHEGKDRLLAHSNGFYNGLADDDLYHHHPILTF